MKGTENALPSLSGFYIIDNFFMFYRKRSEKINKTYKHLLMFYCDLWLLGNPGTCLGLCECYLGEPAFPGAKAYKEL